MLTVALPQLILVWTVFLDEASSTPNPLSQTLDGRPTGFNHLMTLRTAWSGPCERFL